jgi:hypothetical protein
MTSLADQIIEHGPYQPGDRSPFASGVDFYELRALRRELIRGRRLRAAAEAFFGHVPGTESDFWDDTDFANFEALETVVAGLVRRADEHTEGCT